MTLRVLPCGDCALLLEVGDMAEVLSLSEAVRTAHLPGVVDIVPAARTVLVTTEPGIDLLELSRALTHLRWPHVRERPEAADDVLEVPVRYDGPDLPDVAALTGMTVTDVVELHTRAPWRVAFGGFAPGFGYLTRHDYALAVPRRGEARTSVPAGSVALAGEFSGIYPRSSPGGWQLIGRTDTVLWDTSRHPPTLLLPGTWVRFVDVGGSP